MTIERPSSVWEGSDRDLLSWAIPFYLRHTPELILDVTWGSGKWWTAWPGPGRVVGLDIQPLSSIQGDYQALPFQSECADVVVFDPPHRSPEGAGLMNGKFGDIGPKPDGLVVQLPGTFIELSRVLVYGGIVLAKITDQVSWHRMWWHQVEAVVAARASGLTACDMIVKVRSHGITSSKWQNSYHALKRHCFWLVFRKGDCEP